MALPANTLPYGLRDIKLTPIASDTGAYGTMVDLPVARTMSWTEGEDFSQLRGDDGVAAERGSGPLLSGDLEQGGISLVAYAVMAGGTVTETGVSPNLVRTYRKKGTDARPYFRADGMAINDNGGDTKVVLYRLKATGDIGGEFADGAFMLTSLAFTGYPDPFHTNNLYDIVASETSAAIIQPV